LEHAITYLTAETEAGRRALAEVMGHSYVANLEGIPPGWARVRLAGGVPVAYIVVDPNRQMGFPGGQLGFAFICDVATREDRRGEGHFRGLLEDTFQRLRTAGHCLVLTHGRYSLYRRFGFDVFTHHSGVFVTPEQVERKLGTAHAPADQDLLVVEEHRGLQEGLLLVSDIKAGSADGYPAALRAAAALARERGRTLILFEHPAAPSYGSRYPIYPSPDTPFTALARACGGKLVLQGADPEAGTIPDADWIKVLDAAVLLHGVLSCRQSIFKPLPAAAFSLDTDAGLVGFYNTAGGVTISGQLQVGMERIPWASAALAQLVTGYQPVDAICAVHEAPLPADVRELLAALFPPCWRFSRNESWVYRS
jgi:predicted N-acetyltransferase YhbS